MNPTPHTLSPFTLDCNEVTLLFSKRQYLRRAALHYRVAAFFRFDLENCPQLGPQHLPYNSVLGNAGDSHVPDDAPRLRQQRFTIIFISKKENSSASFNQSYNRHGDQQRNSYTGCL